MITLPDDGALSRGPLRAFWLAVWFLAGIVGTLIPWARPRQRALASAGAVVAGSVGLVRPGLARRPYRAWQRMSSRIADVLTDYMAWVAHTTAIPDDPAMDYHPDEHTAATAWAPVTGTPHDTFVQLHSSSETTPGADVGARAPLAALSDPLTGQGVPRARWLAVCLLLLRWLGDPTASPEPPPTSGHTYTLY